MANSSNFGVTKTSMDIPILRTYINFILCYPVFFNPTDLRTAIEKYVANSGKGP